MKVRKYLSNEVPNFKLNIIGPIKYTTTVSKKTGKTITSCIFNYNLNPGTIWNAGNLCSGLPADCNPLLIRTVHARVTPSDNDKYSSTKGKMLARAKAENKAYAVLMRVLHNLMIKQIIKLATSVDLFDYKGNNTINRNNSFINS